MADSGGTIPPRDEGSKGKAEGSKGIAEGSKGIAEGSKRVAEGKKKGAEGIKAKVGCTYADGGSMSASYKDPNEKDQIQDEGKQNKNQANKSKTHSNNGKNTQGKFVGDVKEVFEENKDSSKKWTKGSHSEMHKKAEQCYGKLEKEPATEKDKTVNIEQEKTNDIKDKRMNIAGATHDEEQLGEADGQQAIATCADTESKLTGKNNQAVLQNNQDISLESSFEMVKKDSLVRQIQSSESAAVDENGREKKSENDSDKDLLVPKKHPGHAVKCITSNEADNIHEYIQEQGNIERPETTKGTHICKKECQGLVFLSEDVKPKKLCDIKTETPEAQSSLSPESGDVSRSLNDKERDQVKTDTSEGDLILSGEGNSDTGNDDSAEKYDNRDEFGPLVESDGSSSLHAAHVIKRNHSDTEEDDSRKSAQNIKRNKYDENTEKSDVEDEEDTENTVSADISHTSEQDSNKHTGERLNEGDDKKPVPAPRRPRRKQTSKANPNKLDSETSVNQAPAQHVGVILSQPNKLTVSLKGNEDEQEQVEASHSESSIDKDDDVQKSNSEKDVEEKKCTDLFEKNCSDKNVRRKLPELPQSAQSREKSSKIPTDETHSQSVRDIACDENGAPKKTIINDINVEDAMNEIFEEIIKDAVDDFDVEEGSIKSENVCSGGGSNRPANPAAGTCMDEKMILMVDVVGKDGKKENAMLLKFDDLMKFRFVLNNGTMFKTKCDELKQSHGIEMSLDKERLVLDIKNQSGINLKKVMVECILKGTDNLEINGWPLSGVDEERFIRKMKESDMGKFHEIFLLSKNNTIFIAYNKTKGSFLAAQVVEALEMFSASTKKTCFKNQKLPYVFKRILNKDPYMEKVKQTYPSLEVKLNAVEAADHVIITLNGDQDEVEKAMKLLTDEVIEGYGYCNIQIHSILDIDIFENKVDLLTEYLKLKYKGQTDLEFDINVKAMTIWCSSKTSTGNATQAIDKLKRKGKVVKIWEKTVEQMQGFDECIGEIQNISCEFVHVNVAGQKITVKGLEKYVEEVKSCLEGKLKSLITDVSGLKQPLPSNQPPGSFFEVKDMEILNCLKNSKALEELSKKHSIQKRIVETEQKKGIYFQGDGENCETFKTGLEELLKRFDKLEMKASSDPSQISKLTVNDEDEHDVLIQVEKSKSLSNNTDGAQGMDEGMEKCFYVRWKLPEGWTLTCTDSGIKYLKQDVIIVPQCESTLTFSTDIHKDISGEVLKLYLPVPAFKTPKDKDIIWTHMEGVLKEVQESGFHHVTVQVTQSKTWPKVLYLKPILQSFIEWHKKQTSHRVDLVLCCFDRDMYESCFAICRTAVPNNQECIHTPKNKEQYIDAFQVKIEKAEICHTKADVVVNTTRSDLDLSHGAVSASLLRYAGEELQAEVDEFKPKDFSYGDILCTSSCQLQNCKYIFHGALDEFKKKKDLQMLEDFVFKCLKEADNRRCRSIALPAIGTGNLNYPKPFVAEAMFGAAKKYFRCIHPSSLRCVVFIIYPKDYICFWEFEKQEKKWKTFLECQKASFVTGGVRVQLDVGSFARPGTDALVYFLDSKKMYIVNNSNHSLMKSCSKDMKKKIEEFIKSEKGTKEGTKEGLLQAFDEDIKAELLCLFSENSEDGIYQATLECMFSADKSKNVKSVCIAFDASHPFLIKPDILVHTICMALKDQGRELKQIEEVLVLVENETWLNKMLENFKKESHDLQMKEESETVEVVGLKEEVATDTKTDTEANDHQDDDTETPTKTRHLESCDLFDKYVEVQNVPEGHDKESLRPILFKEGEFPVRVPKLIYCTGRTDALLICQASSDVAELSKCTSLKPFKFSCVEGKALTNFKGNIDQKLICKIKKSGKYDKFLEHMQFADIQIKGEEPFVIVAPTSYQYRYALDLIQHFESPNKEKKDGNKKLLQGPSSLNDASGFEMIETFKDVSENVWEVVCSSDLYIELKKKAKNISYKDSSIIIELSEQDTQLETMKGYIEFLKSKEFIDIPVEEKDKSKAAIWCKEINESSDQECCKYIQTKDKILVFCENYQKNMAIKHLIGTKSGQIKVTGKDRRKRTTKTVTSDNEVAPSVPPKLFNTKSMHNERYSFDWAVDAKNVEKYSTKENITVYAYEANILKLPVDCIVNAANDTLSHGGGVAAVIARAAGYSLTREGNELVKTNGPIPVGTACITTPGDLKYDCVIHAVGPKWSDFNTHLRDEVKDCGIKLYQAVYNSFLEAEKRKLKKIALPAISSAIFGVPAEICVSQYAKAVVDYSRKAAHQPDALEEIHFIDKDEDIVQKIQDMFARVFWQGQDPSYDTSKFVKSYRGHQGYSPHSSRSQTGAHSSSTTHRHGTKGKSPERAGQFQDSTPPEPLSFFDEQWSAQAYLLFGNDEQILLLSHSDMFKIKADAVVVPVDRQGRAGNIANVLLSKMSYKSSSDYTFDVSTKVANKNLCDVFETFGHFSGYKNILHVILPAHTKVMKYEVQKLYTNVFSTCDRNSNISSVVTTLLGADIKMKTSRLECAEMFLEAYLKFCSKSQKKLQVHFVCKDYDVFETVRYVLENYVRMNKKKSDAADEQSETTVEMATEVHPEGNDDLKDENCVICMDSISNPKSLPCGHSFCTECIQEYFKVKEACPICGKVCGIIKGNQPPGSIYVDFDNYSHCKGYEYCGRIGITYSFPSGRQEANHPNPGQWFTGFTRKAYLPDNEEGRKIMEMLKVAFERKLVFTVGSSRTTGQDGVITWNDIHHKTDPRPHTQFGYPDPGYLERVKDELAAKGVTEKDIPKK